MNIRTRGGCPGKRAAAEVFVLLALAVFWGCEEQAPSFNDKALDASATDEASSDANGSEQSQDAAADQQAGGSSASSLDTETQDAWQEFLVEHDMVNGSRSFIAAGGGANLGLSFALEANHAKILLTMADQISRLQVTMRQEERPVRVERFQQGSVDREGQETFIQPPSAQGPLDILVVVDNSGSMAEEQLNLSTKLSRLLNFVADTDWRIAVETTDPGDACGQHVISKGDADPEGAFATAVTRGTQGSGNERGILQAVNGLNCNGGAWLRPKSTLAVLIVSDEDNCSDGTKCGSDPWASEDYLLAQLATLRQVGVNARAYGLVWDPDLAQCGDAFAKAPIYARLIEKSSGQMGAVCDADYSDTLMAVSENLSVILNTQFTLQYPAITDSVAVSVNGTVITSGYQVVGNVLVFDTAPEPGDQIAINYHYLVGDPQGSFYLSETAPISNVEVYADGNKVASSLYQVTNDHAVVFAETPQYNEIAVSYRVGALTKTSFPFAFDGVLTELTVLINGSLSPINYQVADQQITFAAPPPDGAGITISYAVAFGTRNHYLHGVAAADRGSLVVADAATGEALNYSIEGEFIWFAEADLATGRKVSLTYPSAKSQSGQLELGGLDLYQVSSVASGRVVCSPGAYSRQGSILDVSQCGFQSGETVHVGLVSTVAEAQDQAFVLWAEPLAFAVTPEMLEVYIAGERIYDFAVRNDGVDGVSLEVGPLMAGTPVEVTFVSNFDEVSLY